MNMDEYQQTAISTAIYPGQGTLSGIVYCTLKLNGEAGEIAEDVGKTIRDDNSRLTADRKQKLIKELGDVLWYIASISEELGVKLSEVAMVNRAKLQERKARGTLHGSGSDR